MDENNEISNHPELQVVGYCDSDGFLNKHCHGDYSEPVCLVAVAEEIIAQRDARIEELEREIERLNRFKSAFDEWHDKTSWIQDEFNAGAIDAKSLGLHRADVMTQIINGLRTEIAARKSQSSGIIKALEEIAAGERTVKRGDHYEVENDMTIDYPGIAKAALDTYRAARLNACQVSAGDDESRHDAVKAIHDVMQSVPCASLYSLAEAVLDAGYAKSVSAGEYGDAYQGAREDLAIWKRRALEAETKVREQDQIIDHLTLEAQGDTRFGEPVVCAGGVGERDTFEEWADERGFCLDCKFFEDGNNYESADTRLAFDIWMARAALAGRDAVPDSENLPYWVPVSERLPGEAYAYGCHTKEFLCRTRAGMVIVALLARTTTGDVWYDQHQKERDVTHWMPLPPAPSAQQPGGEA